MDGRGRWFESDGFPPCEGGAIGGSAGEDPIASDLDQLANRILHEHDADKTPLSVPQGDLELVPG